MEEPLDDKDEKQEDFEYPDFVPVLPLRNTVVFPVSTLPLSAGREKSLAAIAEAMEHGRVLAILSQHDADTDEPGWDDVYHIGTICRILKLFKLPDGSQNILVEGVARFRAKRFSKTEPFIEVEVEPLEETAEDDLEVNALVANIKNLARKAIGFFPNIPDEVAHYVSAIDEAGQLGDIIAAYLNVSVADKQQVLDTLTVKGRLELVTRLLTKEIEVLELGQKIQSEIRGEIDKNQREYMLKRQLEAIKRELGEGEAEADESETLRKAIDEAGMPEDVQEVALKELNRLTKTPEASAEHGVIRTYLEWLTDLPWSKATDDNHDLNRAEELLDRDHYGLTKVKKRILEYLAVRKLKPDMKGPILCLVGPPGVGKTSLGRSIAESLGRKFARISLGGVRDEAEIRGHRRTYVGSLPGRIIQNLKKAGTNNPVFMLDEVDKLGADFRGDPSSALLEVLDPEQNDSFSDHYLEVAFDLSNVIFIATANVYDTIPPPLLDRMEVIEIPGYTSEEKQKIARNFLVPEQIAEHGLTDDNVAINDDALDYVIDAHTREAGVRNLKRELASVCRSVAKDVAKGEMEKQTITAEKVDDILGPRKYFSDMAEQMDTPGVAIGLAWTPVGGDILFIEATMMKGRGKLSITGRLGDVMKESAETAMSYVRSHAREFGIDRRIFEQKDFHIHVPAGAIPKDGPSAGVTLLSALTSLMTGKLVRSDLAMTGEITLRGNVLPIGGIKEKVLAARRAGVTEVLLPEKNRKDLVDVPEEVKAEMNFHFVSKMHEVLKLTLAGFELTDISHLPPPQEDLEDTVTKPPKNLN